MTKRTIKPSEDTERILVGLAAVTRTIRARDRLSQVELAQRAGLGKGFPGAIETRTANPTVTQLGRLAQGLGLAGASELFALAEEAAASLQAATSLADADKHHRPGDAERPAATS